MVQTRNNVFDRVLVSYYVNDYAENFATIEWKLREFFTDPLPHTFQLQRNYYLDSELESSSSSSSSGQGVDIEGCWIDVGEAVQNTTFVYDKTRVLFGKTPRILYRVKLTTPNGTYYSPVAQIFGNLTKRQWLLARSIVRKNLLQPKQLPKTSGYILKRKLHGTICPVCMDPYLNAPTDPDCEYCNGTGKVDGYCAGFERILINRSPITSRIQESELGTINDKIISGIMLGIPIIETNDIWIENVYRWRIIETKNLVEIQNVPIFVQVTMELLPYTDRVYSINPEEGN